MKFKTYFKELLDPAIIAGVFVILVVAIIITVIFSSKVNGFKQKYKGKFFSYLVVLLLVSALMTFVGSSEIFNGQLFGIFVFYEIAFFILGIIHLSVYRNYLNLFDEKSLWIEMFFAFIAALYVLLPLIIVYTIVKGNLYAYNMALSVIMLVIPTLVYLTFESAITIPPKNYETWIFPKGDAFPPPDDSEFRDMILITYLFYKDSKSGIRTEFTAKAPVRMDFDRVFYHFVSDYNLRNPDEPINIYDENGDSQHWVFYAKSPFWGFARFIRPRYTLSMNGIEDNCTIICHRTKKEMTQKEIMTMAESYFAKDENNNDVKSSKNQEQEQKRIKEQKVF